MRLLLIYILVLLISLYLPAVSEPLPQDSDILQNKCGFHLNYNSNPARKDSPWLLSDTSLKPKMQLTMFSHRGNFRIFFDLTGVNAVPPEDSNADGIPDYIDSVGYYFEYVYDIFVNRMMYRSPVIDTFGKPRYYEIYVIDLGNDSTNINIKQGIYTFYGVTLKDRKLSTIEKFEKWTSFILVDNNFSPLDTKTRTDIHGNKYKVRAYKDTGITALKITAAHEFHHAVQFMYGIENETPSMNEFTSTSMETRLFPDSEDYIQYVNLLFNNLSKYPFGDGRSENGYGYCIFGQYLQLKFGDDIFLKMWENIGSGITAYQALDLAIKENSSSLVSEWSSFMPWIYYTGYRSLHKKFFPQAKDLPEIKFYDTDSAYSPPSYNKTGELKPFEMRSHRCRIKNTGPIDEIADIVITNTDLDASVKKDFSRTKPYSVECSPYSRDNSVKIGNTQLFYSCDTPQGEIFDTLFYDKGIQIAYSYPNPFKPGLDNEILIPVPDFVNLRDKVRLNIFASDMVLFYSDMLTVTLNNANRVVVWKEIPKDITSGIYIFEIIIQDTNLFGKFAVTR